MSLNRTEIRFRPDEPLPATKHNGLVAASAELSHAFSAEHRSDGRHVGLRFEAASGTAVYSIGSWHPVVGMTDGLTVFSALSGPRFLISDDEMVLIPSDRLGVIATGGNGRRFPVSVVGPEIEVLLPHPTADRLYPVSVFVFGLVAAEPPEP